VIDPVLRNSQFYVIVNTVTSLLGSCLSTFVTSSAIGNKCVIGHPVASKPSILMQLPETAFQLAMSPAYQSCTAYATTAMGSPCRFYMMHVQNASLAGGVAIGSAANFFVSPGGGLLVPCY
jgi:hypothetical protein